MNQINNLPRSQANTGRRSCRRWAEIHRLRLQRSEGERALQVAGAMIQNSHLHQAKVFRGDLFLLDDLMVRC